MTLPCLLDAAVTVSLTGQTTDSVGLYRIPQPIRSPLATGRGRSADVDTLTADVRQEHPGVGDLLRRTGERVPVEDGQVRERSHRDPSGVVGMVHPCASRRVRRQ